MTRLVNRSYDGLKRLEIVKWLFLSFLKANRYEPPGNPSGWPCISSPLCWGSSHCPAWAMFTTVRERRQIPGAVHRFDWFLIIRPVKWIRYLSLGKISSPKTPVTDCRWQFAVPLLVTTIGLLRPYVVLCHSKSRSRLVVPLSSAHAPPLHPCAQHVIGKMVKSWFQTNHGPHREHEIVFTVDRGLAEYPGCLASIRRTYGMSHHSAVRRWVASPMLGPVDVRVTCDFLGKPLALALTGCSIASCIDQFFTKCKNVLFFFFLHANSIYSLFLRGVMFCYLISSSV